MASRWDDPSWWPKPREPKPPTNEQVVVAFGLPFLAVGIAVLLFLSARHSGHKPDTAGKAPAVQVTTTSVEESQQQAFSDCMKSLGAGSGFRPRGRFGGGGPSQKFREAYEVCRGLVRSGNDTPPPTTAKTPAPPVA
jgi:hypothetical protein